MEGNVSNMKRLYLFKKNIWYRIFSLAIILILVFSASFYIPIDVYAAGKTITISSADEQTALKLHTELLKEKELTLKVKGNAESSKKTLKSLQNKIKKVNKQGVVFQYKKGKKTGSYFTYKISADNAKLYKTSISFIKKLFGYFKSAEHLSGSLWWSGKYGSVYSLINHLTELQYYHWIYQLYLEDGSTLPFSKYIDGIVEAYPSWEDELLNLDDEYWNLDDEDSAKAAELKEQMNALEKKIRKYGFARFIHFYDPVQADTYYKAFQAKNFCDLSDAMKVWVISYSGYFACQWERTQERAIYNPDYNEDESDCWKIIKEKVFCMIYRCVYDGYDGSKGMRTLLNNKAKGVCHVHSLYELLLFRQLGITVYYNKSDKINHAWTVLKVKNTGGKTLWIPFDYRIGPAEKLVVKASVWKKYLSTEAKRYKIYLSGIKGAPKKRNFEQKDFY